MKRILFFILLLLGGAVAGAELEKTLRNVTADKRARVGIAVVINGRDTVTVGNEARYPMMSVVKFHQALAVAHYLDRQGLSLARRIPIGREALLPDTYSPLRDRFPEGEIELSVGELLVYTLQLSDNNACDILFDRAGGPTETERFVRSLGIGDCAIGATEAEMHADPTACYRNWTTPLAAVELMERFLTRQIVSDSCRAFIRRTMIECRTGGNRLAKPLAGTGAVIGHKTGTSDRNAKGEWIGINDVGFVELPDGQRYSIAVFVRDSKVSAEETERIIAEVSEAVYRYVAGRDR
ncbi:class A beta-lactamase, subclass A2 [uncultured Rikenella sp.]|uniref:class A beta-lactamase, subclass A2 n=1 Tax=uncultured Rikenella sp. TaxID=368003 RepID=UPI002627F0C0|nr:class A beta-lactamase, subclass A2 [uncultured Rikenella sp.]